MAIILDGKKLSRQLREELKTRVDRLRERGVTPGLSVIRVGDDAASEVYVRNKARMCERLGMYSTVLHLPESTTQEQLLAHIDAMNQDESLHGILVQLPLPSHIREDAVTARIDPKKDVDGFCSESLGALLNGEEGFVPCTPKGILRLLDSADIPLSGKRAVVVGRSMIVGKPVSLLLLSRDATVTVCHSRTKDLKAITREADVLIAAVGKPELLTGDFVKEGAVVVDVGINRTKEGIKGDVHFESVAQKAAAITPVPGGVGPMTIIMLMENTIEAAERAARM